MSQDPQTIARQLPIELILMRQLASYLDLPVFLIDRTGDLVYFNEPAEPLLGLRFDDVGVLSMDDWVAAFRPSDAAGVVLDTEDVPLVAALHGGRPVHARLTIAGHDGVARAIESTALPLRGEGGRCVGAVALFWAAPREAEAGRPARP